MEIIEKEIGHVIEIEEQVPMWKMPSIMGRDFNRIIEHINNQDGVDMEIPYARYLGVDWESQMSKSAFANFIEIFTKKWHFQAGIPVSQETADKFPLKYTFLKKTQYIKAIHIGAYQNVGKTYKTMYSLAIEKKLLLDNESIEFYLNDPRKVEKKLLETMVLIPILSKI